MTNTFTTTSSFTRTSASYLASKVVTDLRRLMYYYRRPTEIDIENYYEELVELLVHSYMASVEYGFRRNETRILSLVYEVRWDGSLTDGRPGAVYARADVIGSSWFSFLMYSQRWVNLSEAEKARFESNLPIRRTSGCAPRDGNGYWISDRSYCADGVATQRRIFRPY